MIIRLIVKKRVDPFTKLVYDLIISETSDCFSYLKERKKTWLLLKSKIKIKKRYI